MKMRGLRRFLAAAIALTLPILLLLLGEASCDAGGAATVVVSAPPNAPSSSSSSLSVTVNEVMARNGGTLRDESGSSPDWIELLVKPRGGGAAPPSVNLGGYAVTDDPEHKEVWALPDREVPLTRGGVAHVVIFASGRNATTTAAAAPLHASFKLSDGGEYLAVLDAEGQVVDSVTFSSQYEDVSWGRDSAGSAGHLSRPTPGARNSALVAEGTPLLKRVTKSVSPPPTIEDDITVRACLAVLGEEGRERDPSSAKVELRYKVNFERKEYAVRMEPAGGNGTYCGKSGEATGYQEYVGVLRHKGFSGAAGAHPGDMVRWYVTAENGIGASARSPALDVVAESSADLPRYHGTVVLGAKSTLADLTSQVDKLYWFIQEKDKWAIEKSQCSAFPCLADKDGAHEARCSIYFQGRFYDNVKMRQRGISALLWPKKKFKVDFKGANFKIKLPGDEDISVEEFNLQSHWEEPGEETYMRENIASDFFKDAGLPVFETLHVEVVQNGRFYGLYSIVEQIDENFLKRIGYNPKGHLYKAFSGTASNLNDRVPERLMDKVYRRGNRVEDEDDWSDLHALTQSLAGKNRKYSGVEEYLYNHANIPELVNELALQAAILNQDRCTKNYYVYYDTDMEEWSRFPWDLEAVMGISSALGGVPAPDYCMLVCPQFNSPLYCDSDHPQDPLPNYGSPQAKHYVRKATVVPGLETPEKNYNHLTDALLDTPSIREMYLRRLKTIVDKYLATDYLKDRVNHYYGQIKEIAKKDDSKWGTGDIWEGYEQLLKEQLPQRKQQLMSMYAAGGPEPLLPESQDPSKATVEIKNAYVPANGEYMTSIEVHNPHDFAVDVSGWVVTNSKNVTSARQYPKSKSYCSDVEPKQSDYSCKDIVAWGSCEQGSVKKKGICRKSCGDCRLRSGPLRFTLAAGTVIPSKSSLFITDDVVAYRKSLRQHNMFQHAVGPVDGDLKTYSKKDGFAVYNDLNQKVF